MAPRRRLQPLLALLLLAASSAAEAAAATAQQQPSGQAAVRVAGERAGGEGATYVMLSGLMGGVAGFARLEAHLVAHGHRVISIDPYHLSIDSAQVRFVDLARRVDVILRQYGVDSALVVGHAHGAGVALRLAAMAPQRVRALYFLDVGALPVSRTRVFSSALRLAPYIARIPGGRRFLHGRIVQGLRQNAARHEWLDAATEEAYAGPLIDNIDQVVRMAGRLAHAVEPEPVSAVVARIRAPVTLLLGAAPHESAPDAEEIDALAPLGTRLRIVRLAGVGHFPHEEAPAEVARHLLAGGRAVPPAARMP